MKIKKHLIVLFGLSALAAACGIYFYTKNKGQEFERVDIAMDGDDVTDSSFLLEIPVGEDELIDEPVGLLDELFEQSADILLDLSEPQLIGEDEVNGELQVPDLESSQHLFHPLEKTVFSTPEERLEFFAHQGIEYLNATEVEYAPLLDYNLQESEKYMSEPQEHLRLTDLYDDDITLQSLMPMSIRWLGEEIGHGVFAEDDLPKGGFVGIYGGVVKDRNLVGSKDYAWAYPAETLEGDRISLDAREKGNELRLVNDGKDPNCVVKYILGSDGLWHVCYIAEKNIKKGDQLLVSYGPGYWDTRKYKYQELAAMQ
ncbi:SET domain-containing protein-lysine N-methyltransferase [Candidatus Babeliales bacterium]|nr:SET domain-containing protein-lysine N-methyltransferase [Candidatus Babeliales bacterium]MBP9843432.1 SET domain-containing protein-lysine N-methyltransferase [Candidatus Babeliales bacterium]